MRDYAQLKLALANVLTGLLRSAEHRRSERIAGECRKVLARIAEDRFNLAFVGQFSRGKSSLMNALLGEAKLPTGVLPMTSVVTSVVYGDCERVFVQRQGWHMPQAIRLDELSGYVTQVGNPGNEKQVVAAQIQLPHELLRLGVAFVDTPGVGSAILANTRATRDYLPAIDAAVLVTSVESPMTEAEIALLSGLRERVPTVFIVVNKKDLLAGEDSELLAGVRATVDSAFAGNSLQTFLLSARDALRAKGTGSASALAASGLPQFEAAVAHYLHTRKAGDFLHRCLAAAGRILQEFEFDGEIGRRLRGAPEVAAMQAGLEARVAALGEEIERFSKRLQERLQGDFLARCQEHPGLAGDTVARELDAALCSGLGDGSETWMDAALPWDTLIARVLQSVMDAWKSRYGDAVNALVEEVLRPERPALAHLNSQIAALGSHSVDPSVTPGEEEPLQEFRALAFRELDPGPIFYRPPWWYETIHHGPLRKALFRRWRNRIAPLARSCRSALLAMLQRSATDWGNDVVQEMRARLGAAAARVAAEIRNPPAGLSTSEMERVRRELEALQKRLAGLEDGSQPPTSLLARATAASVVVAPPCAVCARVEREVFDRMAHVQYELFSSDAARGEHVRRLGFCSLHTWQYEAIASPQGVCAAYPPLLERIADDLRHLAKDADAKKSEAMVRTRIAPQACPACAWAAAAAEIAIRELAALPGGEAGNKVCLLHLPALLDCASDAGVAVQWLVSVAAMLDRVAENMRNYQLKHDAVRRGLSTGAERRAAVDGLSRVAGRRSLVAVKSVE